MNKVLYHIIYILCVCSSMTLVTACSGKQNTEGERQENHEAKQMLQGVWVDEDTQTALFRMKGDSVYYADSTSMTAYFRVVDDTLFLGSSGRYPIKKQTEHVLWFIDSSGELTKCIKSDEANLDSVFENSKPQILTLTEVQKRDTVVFYNGERYHIYIAVNPTKYKVARHVMNEDGLDVENIYYDNIIHLSIYHGASRVFSRDFRKALYINKVPEQILSQSILNNLEFDKADDKGFHFRASVCIPDDGSCYMVGHTISPKGQLNTQVLEY